MVQVSVSEAKTQLSRLLERVAAGEEIVICKGGKPYARLAPLAAPSARKPGLLKGRVEDTFFDRLPEDELEAWER